MKLENAKKPSRQIEVQKQNQSPNNSSRQQQQQNTPKTKTKTKTQQSHRLGILQNGHRMAAHNNSNFDCNSLSGKCLMKKWLLKYSLPL